MELLPSNEAQSQFLHNVLMAFITTGSWLVFALVGLQDPTWPVWVALCMMLVFAHLFPGLWFWDMYLRAYFFPESQLENEDFFELAFQKWMANQGSKEQNLIWRLEARVRALEDATEELKPDG